MDVEEPQSATRREIHVVSLWKDALGESQEEVRDGVVDYEDDEWTIHWTHIEARPVP
jgi:hypothetical protein